MARPQNLQEWLYVIIVMSLSLYLIIGVIAWTWMIMSEISAPSAFTTILAANIGALAGILAPLPAPKPRGTDQSPGESPSGASRAAP